MVCAAALTRGLCGIASKVNTGLMQFMSYNISDSHQSPVLYIINFVSLKRSYVCVVKHRPRFKVKPTFNYYKSPKLVSS